MNIYTNGVIKKLPLEEEAANIKNASIIIKQKTYSERIAELETSNVKLQEELDAFKILMGQEV